MQQEPAEILNLFKKSEELVDMLRKGRAFTEELMCENERLRYRVVQLNRMNWRDFLRQRNPAATALMVRMSIPPADRPKVKAQVMRLVTTLKLTAKKMELIVAFVERYLELTAKEMVAFEREMDNILDVREKRNVMELMTSWERKGRQEGRVEGELLPAIGTG